MRLDRPADRAAGPARRAYSAVPLPRAPQIKLRSVPCSACGAGVDEPCLSASGAVSPAGHTERRRMAIRKMNAERGL